MNSTHPWQAVTQSPDLLGESPFWHPLEQQLYWVDIPAKQIKRIKLGAVPYSGQVDVWDMPEEPGCIAPAKSGGLVIAMRHGVFRAKTWQGSLNLIAKSPYDTSVIRFNDGKCDSLGRLWLGTMFEPRNQRLAQLYCLDARGTASAATMTAMQGDAILANGLAWSPDNRTVYWADTADHVIHAWDWDEATGSMSQRRVFQQFAAKPAAWTADQPSAAYAGRPDGCAVDVQGNYYAAMFEGQRILKFAPSGELLATIPTPTRCTTMPCFGGADLKTLFITTASHNRSPAELAAYPQSGQVFAMPMDVAGLGVNMFVDEGNMSL